jgi:hypothetical protein
MTNPTTHNEVRIGDWVLFQGIAAPVLKVKTGSVCIDLEDDQRWLPIERLRQQPVQLWIAHE